MKTLTQVLFLVAIAVSLAFAEPGSTEPRLGVRLGGGIADIYGDDVGAHMDPSFSVGLGVVSLISFESFQLVPEISLFYRQPGTASESDSYSGISAEMTFSEFALEIPVFLRYTFGGIFYVQIAPQVSFVFDSETEIKGTVEGEARSMTIENVDRHFFEFGVAAGLGFNIVQKYAVDLRFYQAETSLAKATAATNNQVPDQHYQTISLGVSYFF
jgi:hypothetical protein